MTNGEAIAILKGFMENPLYSDIPRVCRAFDMAIKALEQTRWIPVSEELPDTDDKVLCWYEYYHWSKEKVLPEYGVGCYCKETEAWLGEVANGRDVRVIAWQPLPKPYEPTN